MPRDALLRGAAKGAHGMLARLKRLIEPRSRADVVRLAIAYSVVAAALSALCTLMLALINHWPLFAPIATAIAIPLLVAPWMFLIVGNVVFRLYQAQKELEQLVRTDPLTGALNRRGTQELMTRTFEQRHDDARFCAIILDIDNFKAINDRYGHAGGDAVIVHVADVMRMAFDHEGFQIVRFGGDELGVLMPGLSIAEATFAAEHLRAAIERTPIVHGDHRIMVTASIGVTELLPEDENPDDLMIRADRSLYDAKTMGRNIVRASGARRKAAA